ncbi:hypothetical protein E3T26_10510 [Cryobacterium sp. TMT1-21]|uniref:hypothetical protein n=1 Tax=Cryobacterium sp. TMT1-21 TaxID=1259234 RepID=UPI00106969BD|nr:hypothetical protein [Cryobacterium sp. TMT1-21]TFD12657.1 hypothetical protein E3T26_10510 [Cryobacterium sp. TMT1-21]
MNKHTINPASATSRTKRIALGAASVLTAGALLGVGAQGATAAPRSPGAEHSASASGDAAATSNGAFLASLAMELRGDLSHGQSGNVKAQKVAATISTHAELFDSLPANLQTDLTTLKDASGATDRAAAVDTVRTTALAGGYGEEITKIAEAVRDNPKHPLTAALRAALSGDLGTRSGTATGTTSATASGTTSGTASGTDQEAAEAAGPSATELALKLADNPALLSKLPADLQADLAALKNAPADQQEAAAQAIETAARNGDYGTVIQKIVERVQAHAAAGPDTDTGADADADVHAGN